MQGRHLPAETTDGVRVQLQLNVGLNTERDWLSELNVQGWACTALKFLL